jgi:hypothetical protein
MSGKTTVSSRMPLVVTTPVILIYAHAQNGSTPTPTIAGLNSSNSASASENQHKIRHDPVFDTKKAEKKLRGFVEANKFAILG